MERAAGCSGNSTLRTLMFNDKIDTPYLGDFLRVKEDNRNNDNNPAGLTLGAVLSNTRECSSSSPVPSKRTLLDIIRDDPNSSRKTRKTWKHFRNKFRLRRAGDTWSSNISIQQHNNPIMSPWLSSPSPPHPENLPVENFGQPQNSASGSRNRILGRDLSRNVNGGSGRFEISMRSGRGTGVENGTAEEEESEGENEREEIGVELEGGGVEDQPVRMSLMSLLTENDGDGSAYMMEDEDEKDDDNGVPDASAGADACGEYNNCCVCMVRHKGAAFIPCGHTFCRLCSRELWVQRGNCPLCNNFILEVLDIF